MGIINAKCYPPTDQQLHFDEQKIERVEHRMFLGGVGG